MAQRSFIRAFIIITSLVVLSLLSTAQGFADSSDNNPPTAGDDMVLLANPVTTTVSVLANDTDPDQNALTVVGYTQGINGAVNCTHNECSYTPNRGYNGYDFYTYIVSDGLNGFDTATVNLSVG